MVTKLQRGVLQEAVLNEVVVAILKMESESPVQRQLRVWLCMTPLTRVRVSSAPALAPPELAR